MQLNFPQHPENFAIALSIQNLDTRFAQLESDPTKGTAGNLTRDALIPQEVQKCFDSIRSNHNGCSHRFKKYSAASLTFTAGTLLPFGAAIGTAYAIKDYAKEITMESLKNLATDPKGHPCTLAIAGGTVALISADAVAQKCGFSLIKPMLNGVATGYALLVNTLTKRVIDCFDKDTERKEAENKEIHKTAVKLLTKQYDADAYALRILYAKSKNDPEQLFKLRAQANKFLREFHQFTNGFKQFDRDLGIHKLNNAEIGLILKEFKSTLEYICGEKLAVRNGTSQEDIAFNADLLVKCPINTKNCIPVSAQVRIAAAKVKKLGMMHTMKKHVASVGAAVTTTLSVPLVAFTSSFTCKEISLPFVEPITAISKSTFCSYVSDPLNSIPGSITNLVSNYALDATTVGLGIVGLTAGVLVGKKVKESYQQERNNSDKFIETSNTLAYKEIVGVYDQLGNYFREQLEYVKHDKEQLKLLKDNVEALASKLDTIHEGIASYGLPDCKPGAVTEKFQEALAMVITS